MITPESRCFLPLKTHLIHLQSLPVSLGHLCQNPPTYPDVSRLIPVEAYSLLPPSYSRIILHYKDVLHLMDQVINSQIHIHFFSLLTQPTTE